MYAGKLRLFKFAPFLPGDGIDFEGKDQRININGNLSVPVYV
jgi:hypothetical protein